MNYYNSARKREIETDRCNTNVLQSLSEKRDATIIFRLPVWMKEEIKKSGKSNADFIIAELAKTMSKPVEYNLESWQKEVSEW